MLAVNNEMFITSVVRQDVMDVMETAGDGNGCFSERKHG